MNNPLVQLDPGLFIWTIITFLVLFALLTKFAWKPLLKMLEGREEMIRQSLADADQAKVELEKLNQESEAIISQARAEAQSILTGGKAAAEKLKEEGLAKAKEQANAIVQNATKQIKVERDKAIAEIKSEVVDLSLSIAEKLIRKNLNKEDNQRLIEESLKKVQSYEA